MYDLKMLEEIKSQEERIHFSSTFIGTENPCKTQRSPYLSHHLLPKLSCSFGSPYPTTISSFIFAKVPS